jgi:S1-C subfamily serine protease
MSQNKEIFCGKDLRGYIYMVGVVGAVVLLGSYWYLNRYGGRADLRPTAGVAPPQTNQPVVTQAAFPGQAFNPGMYIPAATARPITVATQSFRAVSSSMKPSVVNISATRYTSAAGVTAAAVTTPADKGMTFVNPFSGGAMESLGSGIIVTDSGYILSNYHVVEKATEIDVTVFTPNGASHCVAQVVRLNESLDLALLKIEPEAALRPAALGDSEMLEVGDQVLAIGSPFGLDQSVSAGIVSSLRKSVAIEGVVHRNLIQTDAAINQGNSGGPLVDVNGYVVGINTAIYSPTGAFVGVGFAIPINDAKQFVEEVTPLPRMKADLKRPRDAARPRRVAALTGMAPSQNNVGRKRPWDTANSQNRAAPPIVSGSISPHGYRGPCENCHTFISGSQAGQPQPATAMNFASPGGATGANVAAATPGSMGLGASWLGIEAQNVDQVITRNFNPSTPGGAFVNSVYPGSPAKAAGLAPGDIIFKVDGRNVATPQELFNVLSQYGPGDQARLSIAREGQRMNIYMTLSAPPATLTPAFPQQSNQGGAVAPGQRQGRMTPGRGGAQMNNGMAQATPPQAEVAWLGMEIEPLPLSEMAASPRYAGKQGAVVAELGATSRAAISGVMAGDLIVSINRAPVGAPEDLVAAISQVGQQNGALLEVDRDGRRLFIPVR